MDGTVTGRPPLVVFESQSAGVGVVAMRDIGGKNAMSEPFVADLLAALARATAWEHLKVIVLEGLADVFCSGASLSHAPGTRSRGGRTDRHPPRQGRVGSSCSRHRRYGRARHWRGLGAWGGSRYRDHRKGKQVRRQLHEHGLHSRHGNHAAARARDVAGARQRAHVLGGAKEG